MTEAFVLFGGDQKSAGTCPRSSLAWERAAAQSELGSGRGAGAGWQCSFLTGGSHSGYTGKAA